jgi:O-acetyl-ADP-ribose deacetylase (regulator of RNase III)
VAPVYRDGVSGEPALLRGAYAASLRLADAHGLTSIAFPSLGTGAYRYPVRDAATIALGTISAHLQGATTLRDVRVVLFSGSDLGTYAEVLATLGPPTGAL